MLLMARGCWVLLCLLPGAAPPPGFDDLQVVKGMDALQHGEDAQALMLLAPVADRVGHANHSCDEICAEARFLAAQAAANLGFHEDARTYLQDLEHLLPEVTDFILAERARTLRAQGSWNDSQKIWMRLQQRYPQSPLMAEAAFGIADAYYATSQYDKAYAAYGDAAQQYRRSDRALTARFNMARIDEHNGRITQATAQYRNLVANSAADVLGIPAQARLDILVAKNQAAPTTVAQRLLQVDRLLSSRALDEAQRSLQALAATLPDTPDNHANMNARRAFLAYRQQEYETAIGLYGELVANSIGRTKMEYQRILANVYAASGNFPSALKLLRDIALHHRGNHDGRDAQFRAAWIAYDSGDYAAAETLFRDFVTTYPRDRMADEAAWYIAWNAYHRGDLTKAADTLAKLRATYRNGAMLDRAWYWTGRIATQLGDVAGATAAYQRAMTHPSSYYAILAQTRLRELQAPPQTSTKSALIASSENTSAPPSRDLGVTPEALPAAVDLKVVHDDSTPWGASAFDWQSVEGQRALRLMKLGLKREAARLVAGLPAIAGVPRSTVWYARARLLYGLGDFANAYRLVSVHFRHELESPARGHARRYFQIAYPDAHADMVQAAAHEFHVSPLLVLAIMRQESAFDDQADSWASARGLMQIIPVTGRRIAEVLRLDSYNEGVLREPVVNVRFGTWYLAQLVEKFEGNIILAIGSYNAGPQAMQRWVDARAGGPTDEFVEDIPFRETRHYVKSVVANLAMYAQLYAHSDYWVPPMVSASYRDNVNF